MANQFPSSVTDSAGIVYSFVSVTPANIDNPGVNTNVIATYAIVNQNHPPVAISQGLTTDEDTPLSITLTASDVDGDSLTFAYTQPAHGSVTGTGASVVYTPAANYNGGDSFTFTVNDGKVDSASATVSITVYPVNVHSSIHGSSLTTLADNRSISYADDNMQGSRNPHSARIKFCVIILL
jgi:hypothetical protein